MNKKHFRFSVEQLETRYAPATLVNPFTVTYTDTDNDKITVRFTKPVLSDAVVNNVFLFDSGNVNGSNVAAQTLLGINLANALNPAGTSIKIISKPSGGGDGFVNVGGVDATNIDLGKIQVDGDFSALNAGDPNNAAPAAKALVVQSLGHAATQAGFTQLPINFNGSVGKLLVKKDMETVAVKIVGADSVLKKTIIRGSILGGTAQSSGTIISEGALQSVLVFGNVLGGSGPNSGGILATTNLAKGIVRGSVVGGIGNGSGSVGGFAATYVQIDGDLKGGDGDLSGVAGAFNNLGTVIVGGSVIGGDGDNSGAILSVNAGVQTARIGGDLIGGAGAQSGAVLATGANGGLGSVFIAGKVQGGAGEISGSIGATLGITSVDIAGDMLGGDGDQSGGVLSGESILAVRVQGNVFGGDGNFSGAIFSTIGSLKDVFIGHALVSGTGDGSASIMAGRDIAHLVVTNNAIGSAAAPIGIFAGGANLDVNTPALGNIFIGGDVFRVNFLVGYDNLNNFDPARADVFVNTVTVGGNWTESNLICGTVRGNDGLFGTADDELINNGDDPARVAVVKKLVIGGLVFGSFNSATDHFAIVAEQIDSVSINGTVLSLTVGPSNDGLAVGPTGDFDIREV